MDGRQRMHRERRVVPIAPASSSGGKGPAKIPDQKAVKKKLESLEAAAKEREVLVARAVDACRCPRVPHAATQGISLPLCFLLCIVVLLLFA